ncbi:MAG: peptidoglycan DD-metalloendopeptidase family protein [Gemmatimonadaceae bacterium]|jgi:septal ring factor EnvC (AmiA/AmiB activator)|nr:peptidoglycan DD-metalloendopeptidase family protein [Gemmatimonadaceae bacterium]
MRRAFGSLVTGALAAMCAVSGVAAQQRPPARPTQPAPSAAARIEQQRAELDRIRRERASLQRRLADLQGTVHDLAEERRNLAQQADATARAVRTLEQQLVTIGEEVDEATGSLASAEDELALKRAILRRRLEDVYKRGPLYTLEVMLSAESFGGMVSRYKYLHALTLRDRALVGSVERLRDRIAQQRGVLVQLQEDIERSKLEKADEEERLRELQGERTASLTVAQRQARQVESRLAEIERSESRLRGVIATLEDTRRRAEAAAAAAADRDRPRAGGAAPAATTRSAAMPASTIRTSDLGRLDWPVDGELLYRFGRTVTPENTTVRWNGIGIAAGAGTPVKAIADGEVVVAENIGTYGLTVIVQHGAGDYSVYGSLAAAAVGKGTKVRKGQSVGSVGRADPDMPPHLHFEIRRSRGTAVDPLDWLRGR